MSRLRAYRLAYGWTQEELVRRIRQYETEAGRGDPPLGHQRISRWERGERPSPRYLDALCAVLRTRPDRLGFGLDGSAQDVAPVLAETGWTDSIVPVQVRSGHPAGPTAPPPAAAVLARAGELRDVLDRSLWVEVPAEQVDRLDEVVRDQGFRYRTQPVIGMIGDLSVDLAEVGRLLGRRQPLYQQRRLRGVAAKVAGITALSFSDLGHRVEMRGWFETAYRNASEHGAAELLAWVVAKRAKAELENGASAQLVLTIAARAEALAGRSPSAGKLIAVTMQARALGVQKKLPEVLRRARQALDLFDRLDPESTSSSVLAMSEQQLHLYIADALLAAGDWRRSLPHFDRAVRLFPPGEPRDPVLTRINQAGALILGQQVDTGCEQIIRELTGIAEHWRSPLVLRWAADGLRRVPERHRGQSAVRELRDLIATLTSIGSAGSVATIGW
ncbi:MULTISPECIES: helix-turn-helix domain-containing protein [Frankia]|uniref:helix-turn-helix domain-containing protein n=1 Tax=Frankia TaxID=1854 RepID=UPI0002F66C02|nr:MULTISPECIES: helix-turn-helix transcriptional regulator [Frankia]